MDGNCYIVGVFLCTLLSTVLPATTVKFSCLKTYKYVYLCSARESELKQYFLLLQFLYLFSFLKVHLNLPGCVTLCKLTALNLF